MQNWKTIGTVITSVFFVVIGFGQVQVVNFDNPANWIAGSGILTSFQTDHQYIDQDWLFTGGPALRNTNANQDGFPGAIGTYSWRLRDAAGVSWTATFLGSAIISEFGFDVRRWDDTPNPNYSIEYSVNGGVTWVSVTVINNAFLENTSDWFTFNHSIPNISVNSGDFIVRISRVGGERIMVDNFTWTKVPNIISIDAISNVSFTVNCQQADNGTIDFTASGAYLAGNSFQVELSDATGDFASSVVIGSLSGVAAEGTTFSGTIPFTIPAVMPAGSGYRMRLVSTNPARTSPNNGIDINIDLTGTCVPPHVTSLILNSCNSSCSEGDNELFFGNTGDYSLEFTADNTNVFYGTSPSPTTNYISSIHDLPLVTAEFNSNAGCTGLFVDAYNVVVPPNSSFILAHRNVCPLDLFDFTNLCGSGPIYVVYADAPSWSSGGNFVNSTSCSGGFRYLRSLFSTTVNTSHEINFFYECALNSGSTGDFAVWNANGGAATLQSNTSCAFDPTILPIELLVFSAKAIDSQVLLNWSTATELNNDYFTIERSVDGTNWEVVDFVTGQGTTAQQSNYELMDKRPFLGLSYYRLKQTDYDGDYSYSSIAAVTVSGEPRKLMKVVNAIGQEVQPTTPGLIIHLFDDGSSEKFVNH